MNKTIHIFLYLVIISISTLNCKKIEVINNQVPLANAGPSQTIGVPEKVTDIVTLAGSGRDTDGKIVAYLWSQVSGPSYTTIINPGSASTAVQGFQQGIYIFQLMVTDDEVPQG